MKPTEFTTALLVRHGHVPGIDPETFRGRTDIGLTECGRRELKSLALSRRHRLRRLAVEDSRCGRGRW